MDSRGIEYFDDVNCLFPKWHKRGNRNLYKIIVKLGSDGEDKKKKVTIVKNYGNFKVAYSRFLAELQSQGFDEIKFDFHNKVELICDNYNGTKIVRSENMLSTKDESVINGYLN